MAARARLAGLLIAALAAGCGGGGSAHEQHVLACLRAAGWSPAARMHTRVVVQARDGHAEVELTFHASEAAARSSLPQIVPVGEGWLGSVSFRSTSGFTLADEQTIDRCLAS